MRYTKYVYSVLAAAAISGSLSAAERTASSAPSFGFAQEMAGVTKKGDVAIDLYDSLANPTDVRIGAFGGEIMIDATVANTAQGIGYKHSINKNMAAYGMIYLNTGGATSITNITGGFSFSGSSGNFIYNANAEVHSCTVCGAGNTSATNFDAKGAGFFNMSAPKLGGKLMLGGELSVRLSPSPTTTSLYAGARWLPKPNVLIDLGLFTSVPTAVGSSTTTSTFGTPAFARVALIL